MVTQDDLIDLWVCEFTMDDYVEWLLQDRDTKPSLQNDRRARSTDLQLAANQRLAKYVRNGSTEQLHRSEWRFYHG